MLFSLSEINNVIGFANLRSKKCEGLSFSGISIDSRNISNKDLFIAIKGKSFDGHDFISEVIDKGVKAVVIDKNKEFLVPDDYPYWAVSDTLDALQKIALLKRKKLNIPVVAITGSVGKTTTKDMTGELMKSYGKIKVSDQNNNNEIGVALTILGADPNSKLLVIEMGMRGKGQIENLSKYSEPDIAIITNIGTSHIGILGSQENIAKAKCEIVKSLNPKGLVIVPAGDLLLEKYLSKEWKGRVLRINLINIQDEKNFIQQKQEVLTGVYKDKENLIKIDNKLFKISYKGLHNAFNFLFAYAVSREFGIKFGKNNFFEFKSNIGRNNLIRNNKLMIMDETYNASPESVKACINVLVDYPGKHFLVLGSMRELGNMSIKYHLEILNFVNKVDIELCLFVCDKNEENLLKKNINCKRIIFQNDKFNVPRILNGRTNKNDYVLIKGSRFWKLEEIIPLID